MKRCAISWHKSFDARLSASLFDDADRLFKGGSEERTIPPSFGRPIASEAGTDAVFAPVLAALLATPTAAPPVAPFAVSGSDATVRLRLDWSSRIVTASLSSKYEYIDGRLAKPYFHQ
eukprot:scaffold7897_cov248-Pinguiococcus_pyrenoidosus.AAC.6